MEFKSARRLEHDAGWRLDGPPGQPIVEMSPREMVCASGMEGSELKSASVRAWHEIRGPVSTRQKHHMW